MKRMDCFRFFSAYQCFVRKFFDFWVLGIFSLTAVDTWMHDTPPRVFMASLSIRFRHGFISRPTPTLLSFALCLEWINGITLQTLVVWSVIDRTLQWIRPRRKSIASTSIVETCQKYGHDIYRQNSK